MAGAFLEPPCPQADRLAEAGLADHILLPTDIDYTSRNKSYWSQFFEVGGHANVGNNIDKGVTIELGLINDIIIDKNAETVRFGPGGPWAYIYAALAPYDRIVAGGREGQVGLAGLILGGGKMFLTGRRGFACHNVLEFEVVLADGSIVKTNKDKHADLYHALKGGSNNFGIVTSFKMAMVESKRIWGGITIYSMEHLVAVIEATHDFTANMTTHHDDNLVVLVSHNPNFKKTVICTLHANMTGTEKAPAYKNWLAIPEITSNAKITTEAEMVAANNTPANYHAIWFTSTFKNDIRIMTKASETHHRLVEELKIIVPDDNMLSQCIFQPLPKLYAERSVEAGGNVMGLERQKDDGILQLALIEVPTADQRAAAYPKVKAWIDEVQQFAAGIGGAQEWLYMNYADPIQDVLGSYGAENVQFMKEVAARYDPDEVFQKLCPGGFKLSSV